MCISKKILSVIIIFIWTDVFAANINIAELGAKSGGVYLNTSIIQQAIDKCSASGGGTVTIPTGNFLSGTLFLKDNVNLFFEDGAVLTGSQEMRDYKPKHLIYAEDVKNIAITGRGTIQGQGEHYKQIETDIKYHRQYFGWVPHHFYKHSNPDPGDLIRLVNCYNVKIEDVTLLNSSDWNLHVLGCTNVKITRINIKNALHIPTSDGIDISSSKDVIISDCNIYTSDDAICLKNEDPRFWNRACENITVTNCIITTVCNGFKIGTGSHGDFKNIVFSNSVIKCARPDDELALKAVETIKPGHYGNALAPLSGIAIETVDGGKIQGVSVSNIVMEEVRVPIFIRLANRGGRGSDKLANPTPGSLKDVNISNIIAYGASTASSITGIPGFDVENVMLQSIQIRTKGDGDRELVKKEVAENIDSYPEGTMWGKLPVSGFFIRHVNGLDMRDIKIFIDEIDYRPLMKFDDTKNIYINNLFTNDFHRGNDILRFDNSKNIQLHNLNFPANPKKSISTKNVQNYMGIYKVNKIKN